MKTRHGFVSNSSSSSYTCDLCGVARVSYNEGLDGTEMVYCVGCHHTICEEHLAEQDFAGWLAEREHALKRIGDDITLALEQEEYDLLARLAKTASDIKQDVNSPRDPNTVTPQWCPICQMERLPNVLLFRYLTKIQNTHLDIILGEIQERFSDYESFMKFIEG